MHRFVIPLLALCGSIAFGADTTFEPVPQKFLAAFVKPDGGLASVSPDGRHVAYASREKDGPVVSVLDVATWELRLRAPLGDEDRTIGTSEGIIADRMLVRALRWVDNDRFIVGTSYDEFRLLNVRTKAVQSLADLRNGELIVGFGPKSQMTYRNGMRGRLVAVQPGSPPFAYIATTRRHISGENEHELLKVNLDTGRSESVYEEMIEGRVIYDAAGRVRGRSVEVGMLSERFLVYRPEERGRKRWQPLDEAAAIAASPARANKPEHYFGERAFPIAFDVDPNLAFFASNIGRSTYALYGLDLRTGKRTDFAAEDAGADLAHPAGRPNEELLVTDRVSGKTVGIRTPVMRSSTHWLDPELRALQDSLEKQAPGYTVRILNWDDARQHFAVQFYQRASSGGYFLYSVATKQLRQIRAQNSAHAALPLPVTAPWTIARPEGKSLSGFLMLPAGAAKDPRPLVVLLASYPWIPANNLFNEDAFAIAQMGFAVLEVNHRGVYGFGREHWLAGRERLAEVMAEDITAAIDAIPAGVKIDPRRVALVGADLGGHQALRLAQLRPDRFTCVVGFSPVVDLGSWMQLRMSSEYFRFEHASRQWFFGSDAKQLKAASAGSHVGALRAPVLFIPLVDKLSVTPDPQRSAQDSLLRALEAAGLATTYDTKLNFPDAALARAHRWGKMEAFLNEKLRAPTAVAAPKTE